MERETGIEPATNSLEGCDSTTELLPPSRLARLTLDASADKPAVNLGEAPPHTTFKNRRANLPRAGKKGWWGGEGSNLRSL